MFVKSFNIETGCLPCVHDTLFTAECERWVLSEKVQDKADVDSAQGNGLLAWPSPLSSSAMVSSGT